MKKYIISKHALYDSEKDIWRVDIGEESISGNLLYSCYGKSAPQAFKNAAGLVVAMERQNAIDKFPKVQ